MPRVSKAHCEDIIDYLFQGQYSHLNNFHELVRVAISNYYDHSINLNEFIYNIGHVLEDEHKKQSQVDMEIRTLPKSIERYMNIVHSKNVSENISNNSNKKIDKNISDNISNSQKLLLFAGFLAANSSSKFDSLLFKGVKKIRSSRIKVFYY
jgi:CO dehydrogenase/acetyl-CoA synthase epsilon subunit